MKPIHLDGKSLGREQVVAIAYGASVELDAGQLREVQATADFLAGQVLRQEPLYGVSTGFGSNADKLLGTRRLRDGLPGDPRRADSVFEELQHNLIVTHAVCVGEPFPATVVRAMLEEVPPGGALVVSDYATIFGAWLLRAAEGARPDVALVFRGQMHRLMQLDRVASLDR